MVELLLQQRAVDKYHCGGLWTNTCCSHPRPGETTLAGASRRLQEELGFTVPLREIGCFHYIAEFDNGLTENEVDHIFLGEYLNEAMDINPAEIQAVKWCSLESLKIDMLAHAANYTPWFAEVITAVQAELTT